MQDNENLPPDAETPTAGAGTGRGRAGKPRTQAARLGAAVRKAATPRKSLAARSGGTGRRPGGRAARDGEEAVDPGRVEAIVAHLRTEPGMEPEPASALLPGVADAPPGQKGKTATRVIEIRPPAGPARLRPRHRGLMLSFALVVVLPVLCAIAYLFLVAEDQYASTVGFTVRREEGATSSTELLGGLAQFAGASGSSESDILYEFIQSQEIVSLVDERIGLGDLYSVHWPGDPLLALRPDPTIEQLHRYWGHMVRISYDQGTKLIELRVLAFRAEDAQRIAQEIVTASQNRINDLNNQAREDVMRYANEDLDTAVDRLKAAREALSRFRSRTQIVDPAADIQGRMGVLNNLQQQLAQALIENDLVLGTTQEGDPRREQATRRIQVIRDRIAAERETFASDGDTRIAGETYPALIAQFESLAVDLQFAEETYRAALAAVDMARANASRQSLYLAPYITPTLPQTAEFPQRVMLSGMVLLFLVLIWAIGALIYYSVRDRN